jgi:hypothetical protein
MTTFERVQSGCDPTRPLYTPVHRFPLQMPRFSVTGCILSRDSARESAATLNNPSLHTTQSGVVRGEVVAVGARLL